MKIFTKCYVVLFACFLFTACDKRYTEKDKVQFATVVDTKQMDLIHKMAVRNYNSTEVPRLDLLDQANKDQVSIVQLSDRLIAYKPNGRASQSIKLQYLEGLNNVASGVAKIRFGIEFNEKQSILSGQQKVVEGEQQLQNLKESVSIAN